VGSKTIPRAAYPYAHVPPADELAACSLRIEDVPVVDGRHEPQRRAIGPSRRRRELPRTTQRGPVGGGLATVSRGSRSPSAVISVSPCRRGWSRTSHQSRSVRQHMPPFRRRYLIWTPPRSRATTRRRRRPQERPIRSCPTALDATAHRVAIPDHRVRGRERHSLSPISTCTWSSSPPFGRALSQSVGAGRGHSSRSRTLRVPFARTTQTVALAACLSRLSRPPGHPYPKKQFPVAHHSDSGVRYGLAQPTRSAPTRYTSRMPGSTRLDPTPDQPRRIWHPQLDRVVPKRVGQPSSADSARSCPVSCPGPASNSGWELQPYCAGRWGRDVRACVAFARASPLRARTPPSSTRPSSTCRRDRGRI